MLPIQQESITGQVLEAIADYIAKQKILPGDRLPTERELAERLRVGRSTIREALNRWQALGIIEKRQGSGSYLRLPVRRDVTHITLALNIEKEALQLTHELRRALDTEAAALAAARATDADLRELESRLERLEQAQHRYGRAPDEDWEFHLAIYRCTQNPLFEQILTHMWPHFHRFFERPLGIEGFSRRSFELHRRLYQAIAEHDPKLARETAMKILEITEEDLQRGGHEER